MSVWDWVWKFYERVNQENDPERKKLRPFLQRGLNNKLGPDQNLASFEQGRELAEKLGERWWVLMFDHWRIQKLLFHKRNFKEALDLAVRSVVEVRKPVYASFPQRVCLHEDLINAHIGIDPAGNAGQIEQAIEYMEREVGPGMECRFCLLEIKIGFALELDRLEKAEALGAAFIVDCEDNDTYYKTSAYQCLCRVAFAREDWKSLLAYAEEGEPLAKQLNYPGRQLEFLACRTLATFRLGDASTAGRLYFRTATENRRIKDTPSAFFYNLLNSYLEATGKNEEALRLRQQQLGELQDSGQLTEEARCRVDICRQLFRKGQLEKTDLEAARQTAARLADPTPYLARLDELEK